MQVIMDRGLFHISVHNRKKIWHACDTNIISLITLVVVSQRTEGRCELLLRPPMPRAAAKLFLRHRIGAKNNSVCLAS